MPFITNDNYKSASKGYTILNENIKENIILIIQHMGENIQADFY